MKKLLAILLVASSAFAANAAGVFRPPSVPLVVHTPYFSVWSPGDRLADVVTESWTGAPQPLNSLIRVDGRPFRLMGVEPSDVPALRQVSVQVLPLRTLAEFEDAGIRVNMTFMTPSLLDDLDVLARPVTYLTWEVRSSDGQPHEIELYIDASTLLALNKPNQPVTWNEESAAGMTVLRAGTQEQPILKSRGDLIRIDWGRFYLAAPQGQIQHAGFGGQTISPASFAKRGGLPAEALSQPQPPGTTPPCARSDYESGASPGKTCPAPCAAGLRRTARRALFHHRTGSLLEAQRHDANRPASMGGTRLREPGHTV